MASSSCPSPLIFVLLLVVACCLGASPEAHADDLSTSTMTVSMHDQAQLLLMERFHQWMAVHNRSYANVEEKLRRFQVYRHNMEYIEATNQDGGLTYKLGETPFTDLTHDEFLARYTGGLRLRRKPIDEDTDDEDAMMITTHAGHVTGAGADAEARDRTLAAGLPASIDWRRMGVVTPVKNQGACSACWAFSAVAAIESLHRINGGNLITLSEQELVDCDDIGKTACSPGDPDDAFRWVRKNGGLINDRAYPYVGHQQSCKTNMLGVHDATIRGLRTVPPNNEFALMAAVARQPVVVAFDASDMNFQHYKGVGVYMGNNCSPNNLNHALTIVGYGENHPDTGGNYWIAKNSYGTNWGDNGFVILAKDTGNRQGVCGLATGPSYPIM